MRLFAGVWPTPEVRALLAALERPDLVGVRWTSPDQWHATLAFFGDVAEEGVDRLAGCMAAAAASVTGPVRALLGPELVLLGPGVLCAPVTGLEPLAAAVRANLPSGIGQADDPKPYRGHVTVARARHRHRIPRRLANVPVTGRWCVGEVALVRSELGAGGARYTTLSSATVPS